MAKHGTELVDDITARIDAALSGYETQQAGDTWYAAEGDRPMMATSVRDEVLQQLREQLPTSEEIEAAVRVIRDGVVPALQETGQLLLDAFRPLYEGLTADRERQLAILDGIDVPQLTGDVDLPSGPRPVDVDIDDEDAERILELFED